MAETEDLEDAGGLRGKKTVRCPHQQSGRVNGAGSPGLLDSTGQHWALGERGRTEGESSELPVRFAPTLFRDPGGHELGGP